MIISKNVGIVKNKTVLAKNTWLATAESCEGWTQSDRHRSHCKDLDKVVAEERNHLMEKNKMGRDASTQWFAWKEGIQEIKPLLSTFSSHTGHAIGQPQTKARGPEVGRSSSRGHLWDTKHRKGIRQSWWSKHRPLRTARRNSLMQ